MARSESSKIERIQGLPMFDSVGRRGLGKLAQACDELDFAPGYTLITEGKTNTELFVVESGVASVSVGGELVAEIIEGQAVGELAFFDPGPATATVTAKEPMSVLVIPHNFQRDLAAGRQPELQLNIDATLVSQAFIGAGYITQIVNGEVADEVGLMFNLNGAYYSWWGGVILLWIAAALTLVTGLDYFRKSMPFLRETGES